MNGVREIRPLRHGAVLAAGHQSAGRGRIAGRTWDGKPDENLSFSIYLDAMLLPFKPVSLSIRTAFAVCAFLGNEYKIEARVKWPNDVLVNGRKISGILLDARKNEIIIGCGINCVQTEFAPFKTPATSLALEKNQADSPLIVLGKFLPFLYREIANPVLLETRTALVWMTGEQIEILTGHPESGQNKKGRIAGLNEDGSLRLESAAGTESIYSGEICRQ